MAAAQIFLCLKKKKEKTPLEARILPGLVHSLSVSTAGKVRDGSPYEMRITWVTIAKAPCKRSSFTQKHMLSSQEQFLRGPISGFAHFTSTSDACLDQNTLWHNVPHTGGWDRPGRGVRTHRLAPHPAPQPMGFLLCSFSFKVKKN